MTRNTIPKSLLPDMDPSVEDMINQWLDFQAWLPEYPLEFPVYGIDYSAKRGKARELRNAAATCYLYGGPEGLAAAGFYLVPDLLREELGEYGQGVALIIDQPFNPGYEDNRHRRKVKRVKKGARYGGLQTGHRHIRYGKKRRTLRVREL
jgi:hypothetical protein